MSTYHIPYNILKKDVFEILHREFQVQKIQSIHVNEIEAVIKVEDPSEKRSNILNTIYISNIRIDVVNHHSALLPIWLSLKSDNQFFTILHIDAHNDLGSPNLLKIEDKFIDRWTGDIVIPSQIKTVRKAIDSASIEIGSFLTTALNWLPIISLIWVYPEENKGYVRGVLNPSGICLKWLNSDFLDTQIERLNVIPIIDNKYDIAIHVVKNIELLHKVLLKHPDNNIILDIDLDYFDNSDENSNLNFKDFDEIKISDEWIVAQKAKIKKIIAIIPFESVVSIGIACSPGFCPSQKANKLLDIMIESLYKQIQKKENMK